MTENMCVPKTMPTSKTSSRHPALDWCRGIGLAAILLGGFGVLPFYYLSAVLMCYFGFGLLVVDLCFEPKLRQHRILQGVLLSVLLVMTVAFTFGFVFVSAPLNVHTNTYSAEQPPNTKIAGLEWSTKYTELDVQIINPTSRDYEDLNIVLRPDQPVVAIGEVGELHRATFEDAAPVTPQFRQINESGESEAFPEVLIATTGGYRVRSEKLSAHSYIYIVMAVASVHEDPSPAPYDDRGNFKKDGLLKISLDNGSFRWFTNVLSASRFDAKPSVTKIQIDGDYRVLMQKKKTSQDLPVKDSLDKAALDEFLKR